MKIVIFNQDLRIIDNPALFYAQKQAEIDQQPILPIFIIDEGSRKIGGASRWFLHFALRQLEEDLQKQLNLKLLFFQGSCLKVISDISQHQPITEIYFNRLYEPFNVDLALQISSWAENKNIKVLQFDSYLLFDPKEIKNQSGGYFKVFTPFWKHCLKNWALVREPIENSQLFSLSNQNLLTKLQHLSDYQVLEIDNLKLLPNHPNWAISFAKIWYFDRQTILANFNKFLEEKLNKYKENRNFPAINGTSMLSPYLHFGLISVAEVINLVKKHHQQNMQNKAGTANFLSEIGWREFSHHLLYHFRDLPVENFRSQFDNFAWQNDLNLLQKWQQGKTGYPIVDAAMQELWQTGFMHGRSRMICGSFLIKDLLVDWRFGEQWFWDCLVDANLANNSASWQWVSGSGADGAPYFRIFNPILQSEKFDPEGNYIKKWLPQLRNIPAKFVHQPWQLSQEQLQKCGVELGKNYPHRIIIHQEAKERALEIYKTTVIKQS